MLSGNWEQDDVKGSSSLLVLLLQITSLSLVGFWVSALARGFIPPAVQIGRENATAKKTS